MGLNLLDSGKFNAAANRLYYALFQAAVHTLESKHGKTPDKVTNGATYWRHAMVRDNMELICDGDRQKKIFYKAMLALREEADYKPTTVTKSQLDGRRDKVIQLVSELTK